MKNSTIIIIFFVLSVLQTQAQDYLIGFDGSGDTNVVSTIKVDNLTSGDTVTLNGTDVLHLFSTVGIGSVDAGNGNLQLYPNPMAEHSVLTFVAPDNGNALIGIVDLSGKIVFQSSTILTHGEHSFRISGISGGMYFVNVSGNNYFYSAKLISHRNHQSEVEIEHISSAQNSPDNRLKSTASTINMPYTDGDQLLFKGISGKYSTVFPDVPTSSKTITFNFAACTDADNNNYTIVQIGTQTWMAENLNVGNCIDSVQKQTNNNIIEKYCYNDEINNCNTYGGLYQWNEMMQYVSTPGVQGICPTGWHLPTVYEWMTLMTNLEGEWVAGGKMKSTGNKEAGTGLWLFPNTGATNESGFTAFPAGSHRSDSSFHYIGSIGYWWSSTEVSTALSWFRSMSYISREVLVYSSSKSYGFSVRCLQDF